MPTIISLQFDTRFKRKKSNSHLEEEGKVSITELQGDCSSKLHLIPFFCYLVKGRAPFNLMRYAHIILS
jgi:hypothetical protein